MTIAMTKSAVRPYAVTRRVLLVCWLSILFEGYDVGVMGAVLSSMAEDAGWGLTPLELGALSSYALVGMFFGAFAAGSLSERIGRRRMLLLCVGLFSLSMIATTWAPTPLLFGVARFIGGLGLGGVIPVVAALTVEYSPPERRSYNYGIMYSGYSLGILCSALVAMRLIPHFGWRSVIGVGALPLLVLWPMSRLLPESLEYLVSRGRMIEARELSSRLGVPQPEAETPRPQQFAYSLLTRSQRISHENLRLRDPQWLNQYEQWLAKALGVPPILTPYQVRGVTLKNRTVISPVLLYQAKEGVPGMFHLMHLGSRAVGGAGLVMTEMTAVSPQGRITPGCPGLWNDEQVLAWRQVTDFVHQNSVASIGVQLGHAGRRGSTQRGDEKPDRPLAQGNWPLISASPLPYHPGVSQVPAEATAEQLETVIIEFSDAARRAAKAGFDWLEIQAAHGVLLSSFISPLTNQRQDEYGGSLENRLRFPLAVFRAVREVWPQHLPISVRISATDWVEGGTTVDEAVEIARRLREAGVDMITCSSGEVSVDQKPVYGRMFQTPMADRLRNEGGIATMAVGAISDADQVNSIIASGRADLCAIGRPALADANWLQRECARYGWSQVAWHPAYRYGRDVLQRALHPQEKSA